MSFRRPKNILYVRTNIEYHLLQHVCMYVRVADILNQTKKSSSGASHKDLNFVSNVF